MSNAVEDFLHALKRTISGDPYPAPGTRRYEPHGYRVVHMRDPLQGVLLSGKYRVESRIGKGAMATVYKAVQEPIDRVVALKVLNRNYSNDNIAVRRFGREAKTVSALRHRNILAIHDIGSTDLAQPFFVMEYLEGISLQQLIERRGPVPIARAVPIFCQVCDGMAYAHDKGLIHRDLKPGNIMLIKEEPNDELVKLVDFGIVKVSKASQKLSQKLTQKGEIWGSPIYMSPEQCMGKELDGRSDIYSLGLVMYEALLGVPALDAKAAIGITVSRQLSQMPPAFKEAAPTLRIPESLENIVFKAIQKKPDDRYSSMDDLRGALEEFGRLHGIKLRTSMGMRSFVAPDVKANSSGSTADAKNRLPAAGMNVSPDAAPPPISPFENPKKRDEAHALKNESSKAGQSAPAAEAKGRADTGPSINQIKILIAASFVIFAILISTIVAVVMLNLAKQKTPDTNANTKIENLPGKTVSKAGTYPRSDINTKSSIDGKPGGETRSIISSDSQHLPSTSLTHSEASQAEKSGQNDDESKTTSDAALNSVKSSKKSTEKHSSVGRKEKPKHNKPELHEIKNSEPKQVDDDALLEKIHLKKHRRDDTQQWMEIQQKENQ